MAWEWRFWFPHFHCAQASPFAHGPLVLKIQKSAAASHNGQASFSTRVLSDSLPCLHWGLYLFCWSRSTFRKSSCSQKLVFGWSTLYLARSVKSGKDIKREREREKKEKEKEGEHERFRRAIDVETLPLYTSAFQSVSWYHSGKDHRVHHPYIV